MTAPTLTITDRVQAGAAWLDEHRPGWWQRIDLDTLDLCEPCYCVLGQEFAYEAEAEVSYWRSGYAVAVNNWLDDGISTSGLLGFGALLGEAIGDGEEALWDRLTDAWRELILARRAGTDQRHSAQPGTDTAASGQGTVTP